MNVELDELTPEQIALLKRLGRGETDEEKRARLERESRKEEKKAQDARKSPYRNFLQVNQANYKAEDWLMKTSPAAYRLFRFITQNMDNYNALMCSYKVFEESLGYKQSTIFRAVKLLKEKRFIQIAKSGTNNIYFINKELYWHSYGIDYARAEFGAKIIISADEQEKTESELIKAKAKKFKALTIGVECENVEEPENEENHDNTTVQPSD